MKQQTGVDDARLSSHLKRCDHQRARHPFADGPTDDATAEQIQHHGQIQPAFACRHVGDVADPLDVWSLGAERAIQHVRCNRQAVIGIGRLLEALALVSPRNKAVLLHQAFDALVIDESAHALKCFGHLAAAVTLFRLGMNRAHLNEQCFVLMGATSTRPSHAASALPPGMKATD